MQSAYSDQSVALSEPALQGQPARASGGCGTFANVLVRARRNGGFTPVDVDIIKAAKKDPAKLTIASSGNGSSTHLTSVMMQRMGDFSLTHVPQQQWPGVHRSDQRPCGQDVHVPRPPSRNTSRARSSKPAIAAPKRSPFAPDVPTMNEAGIPPGSNPSSRKAFKARATPPDTVAKINAAVEPTAAHPGDDQRPR